MADTTDAKEKPEVSDEMAVEMFGNYDSLSAQESKLQAELDKIKAAKSDAVQEIADAMGSGPFEWKGQKLTIMKRGTTFFFKGESKKDVKKIG